MKRLFVIIVALFVGFAYGANENVPTSKKFVDAALAQKQPKFDGLGNDKLMLYSNTTDGVVASRDIVTTLGTSTSADTVPTVGAINAGLNTKQDILNGDAGWVAENTGIAGAVVQKPVYSATNNYSNALVEVETLNNAVINAVNSELTVVPGVGWTINTASNLNLLPTPQTYNDVPPGGYTRLEYLESTGEQYIDTAIVPNQNYSMELTLQPTVLQSRIFAGTRHNNSFYDAFTINCGNNGQNYYVAFGNHIGNTNVAPLDTKKHTIKISQSGYIFDNTRSELSFSDFDTTTSIYLFACNEENSATLHSAVKIYDAKIWNQSNIIGHFIPARRNADNVLGMYDTVSGTFFTNAGTGTFIAGPDVQF